MKEAFFDEALSWFQFATTDFLIVGNKDHNEEIGKIHRSMLQCYLELDSNNDFNQILGKMEIQEKKNPLTLYYNFVFHIRAKGTDSAIAVLSQIDETTTKETINLLALCVVEAIKEQSDDSVISSAIENLLKKCVNSVTSSPMFSIALRSSTYLYCKMLEDPNIMDLDTKIVTIVELVKMYLKSVEGSQNNEATDESQWYASQCFNVGLKLVNIGILKSSVVELFQLTLTAIKVASLKECNIWIIRCNIIIAYITKQSIISSESGTQGWREVLGRLEVSDSLINQYKVNGRESIEELSMQVTIMSFECMMNLGEWNSIIPKITKMSMSGLPLTKEYNYLMELIYEDMNGFLESKMKMCEIIMTCTVNNSEIPIGVLFKWVRIMFDLFGDIDSFGTSILKQLHIFYEVLLKTPPENQGFEMEWLTSKFWNKGVTIIVESGEIASSGDSSFDEISGLSEASIKKQRGLEWCESAIKFSNISNESMSTLFKELLPKLIASVTHESKA